MPRKHQPIHYECCPNCQGTGVKEFIQSAGRKIKKSFQKGGIMHKIGTEALNTVKPYVRPIANDLLNTGKTALQAYAPELSPVIEAGSQVLHSQMDKKLTKSGMGVSRKGRFVKGSKEAKEHMAKLRAMRGKGIPSPPSRLPNTSLLA